MDAPPIRAVSFDAGGTLFAPWPSVGHVYAEVAREHGSPRLDPGQLNQRFRAAWGQRGDFRHTREQWSALVDRTFAGLVDPPPSRSFFPALYDRFAQPNAWRIFDDVRPTLRALRNRNVILAVISNWDDRLVPLLKALDLHAEFRAVVVSCQVGITKPDSGIFQSAANALGLPAHAILHVGDEAEADVQGARQAGFQSLLLDRGRRSVVGQCVASLAEVLIAVDESRRCTGAD